MRVGLVSDTHGLVDPKLERLFAGCHLVLHGGDVTRHPVLQALAAIAPVRAVRGNNDLGPFGESLPETALVELGPIRALLVHDLGRAERPTAAVQEAIPRSGAGIVVHGHSHRPAVAVHGGVLFVNPGSAGPGRFSLPRSAALLEIEGRSARVVLFDLAGVVPMPLGEPFEADL